MRLLCTALMWLCTTLMWLCAALVRLCAALIRLLCTALMRLLCTALMRLLCPPLQGWEADESASASAGVPLQQSLPARLNLDPQVRTRGEREGT